VGGGETWLSGAEADSYALGLVMAAIEGQRRGQRRREKSARISLPRVSRQSGHQIARTMDELMAKAVADIKAGR